MKNRYYLYIVIFVISILLFSCKRKEEKQVKGREYITESGFKEETTESKQQETTTKKFDIIKHPELWDPTNKDTFIHLLKCLFLRLSKESYVDPYDDDRLLITDNLRKNCDFYEFCLGFVDIVYTNDADKTPETERNVICSDEQFYNHQFEVTTSNWEIDRTHTFEFFVNDGKLDDIKLINSVVTHNWAEESEEIRETVIGYDEYRVNTMGLLVVAELDEFETWRNYDLTQNFNNKFNAELGLINGLDQYKVLNVSGNSYTDIDNHCVGLTITLRDNNQKKYIVYYTEDNNKNIDSIDKIEEVLEDGTVVEVENNFGK